MKFVFLLGRRMIMLIILVLLGLEGIVYVYYTPSAKPPFNDSAGPTRDTLVLIWDDPFRHQIWRRSCRKQFDISGCQLTNNRSEYENADGVMFHHRDIQQNISTLWNMSRPRLQKWVWMNMESPENSHRAPGLDDLFNLTSTYRRDSDVWVPYGRIVKASDQPQTFKIPEKDKLVCWVVNNWNRRLKRVEYYKELSKHINIDTYGGYFRKVLNLTEYFQTISSCKFYLAFENSIHRDYFTEKLFNPMSVGTVPVVLGPPRKNYEEFLPAHSFIHVDDFKSPRELAKYLTFFDQNPDFYEQYFTWRKHFTVTRSNFALEHACRICDYLRQLKEYRVVKNLSTWYWS